MKATTCICTVVLALVSGSALADHCANELAEAEWAIDSATLTDTNRLEAAEALLDHALEVCDFEEQQLINEGFDSPLSEPTYVSLGQSMLINARELASGQ